MVTQSSINSPLITLGAPFTMSGAFDFTGTLTGITTVTFPTNGTLATTSGTVSSLTGTINQVLCNNTTGSAQTGAITLTLPQDIATTSSPTFLQPIFTQGGSTYGLSQTPSLILGTQNSKAGAIKFLAVDSSAYGIIQATTVNLHLDCPNSGSSGLYLNNYATGANTYIQPLGGSVAVGVNAVVAGSIITLSGANATGVSRYSLYATAPSGGATSNASIYTTNVVVGTYIGVSPPSNGMIVSGKVGIGISAVVSDYQIQIGASTNGYVIASTGSMIGVDGSLLQAANYILNTFAPTAGAVLSAAYFAQPTFATPTSQTITNAACILASPIYTGNAGTITKSYGFYYDGGQATVGTITTAYGAYFTTPVGGTTKLALYSDSLSLGYATTAPPTNGAIITGSVAIGTSSSNSKAILTLSSTTLGFLPPSMTTTQKNAITSPPAGLIVYDNVLLDVQFYNGTSWIGDSTSGVTSITGTANQVIASAATGAVTLSLPQSINTGATVRFGKIGLGVTASNNQISVNGKANIGGGDTAAPASGLSVTGEVDILQGGSTYGLSQTPSIVLGTQDSNSGCIKILGMDATAYSVIQTTTINLHLDASNAASSGLYLNNYATVSNTYIQPNGGSVGLCTGSAIAGALVTILGANATGNDRYSIYATAPSGGATSNTCIYTTNIGIGTYIGVTPPSNGMIVSGLAGFGISAVAAGQVQIASTLSYGLYQTGTQTALDGSSFQAAHQISTIFTPTNGSTVSAAAYYAASFVAPSAKTITFAFGLYVAPVFSANVGTITTAAQISLEAGGTATGTLTNHIGLRVPALTTGTNRYGISVAKPSAGTLSIAAYLENCSIGTSAVNPPTSGLFVSGTSAFGYGTNSTGLNSAFSCDSLGGTNILAYVATSYSSGIATGSSFVSRQAAGTQSSPTATQSADWMGVHGALGYYTGSFASGISALIAFVAAENFTSTAWGTDTYFLNTPKTTNTTAETFRITSQGSIVCGGNAGGAIATNATGGFLYLPSCAGTPTGTPTTFTGRNAFVYDTSANKIWVYNAAWRGILVV